MVSMIPCITEPQLHVYTPAITSQTHHSIIHTSTYLPTDVLPFSSSDRQESNYAEDYPILQNIAEAFAPVLSHYNHSEKAKLWLHTCADVQLDKELVDYHN